MQCVVLAGGLGTRMGAWTERMPKALIPVGGRPFAELQMQWLASQGVTEVVYSIGYRGDMLREALGDGSRWSLPIRYVDEGADLRGTGGALRLAADHEALDAAFLVLYGDSFLPVDFADVFTTFLRSSQPGLMTVFRNNGQWDRSNASYLEGRVRYDKRRPTPDMHYIDYGLSALTRDVIDERVPSGAVFDLADLFHVLSLEDLLAGYEVSERFYEIGSPEGLRQLEQYLQSRV
jgi:NDP-sugar pyrophosphorylase family protein